MPTEQQNSRAVTNNSTTISLSHLGFANEPLICKSFPHLHNKKKRKHSKQNNLCKLVQEPLQTLFRPRQDSRKIDTYHSLAKGTSTSRGQNSTERPNFPSSLDSALAAIGRRRSADPKSTRTRTRTRAEAGPMSCCYCCV